MPQDPETGESFDSPIDALRAAGVEDAEEVMKNLEESGYSLEPSAPDVGIMLAVGEEGPPDEGLGLEEDVLEEEPVEAAAPPMEEGLELPLPKRRDAVAESLMDKYKTSMV